MDRFASINTFVTVVGCGSFVSAAERLNMSPATATYHVQWLEGRLGARLLNRSTRKISLTEAGRAYYDQCAAILAKLEAADSGILALTSMPRGTLRLNAANALSAGMAPLIGGFGVAYPEIAIELITTDGMVDLVQEGIDLAIRFNCGVLRCPNQMPDSSLIVRRLGHFRLILCAAPTYLEKHGVPREPNDLARHRCIAYMYPGFDKLTRAWCLNGADGKVSVPVSCKLQTNSIETLLNAALDGRGIVMACSRAADAALRSGRLLRVLPDYNFGDFPIVAVYPHRQHVSAKVRSFVDFAAKHFAEEPAFPDGNARRGGRPREQGAVRRFAFALRRENLHPMSELGQSATTLTPRPLSVKPPIPDI